MSGAEPSQFQERTAQNLRFMRSPAQRTVFVLIGFLSYPINVIFAITDGEDLPGALWSFGADRARSMFTWFVFWVVAGLVHWRLFPRTRSANGEEGERATRHQRRRSWPGTRDTP